MDINENSSGRPAEGADKCTANDPITNSIIQRVGCPCHVFDSSHTNEQVNEAYHKARARGAQEGFTPVLVTSDETLDEWLGILQNEDSYSPEKLLQIPAVDGRKLLRERYREYIQDYMEDVMEGEGSNNNDNAADNEILEPEEFLGTLAGGEKLSALTSFNQIGREGIQEVILFEIPVKNPWEIAAWLPIGGWNECPPADEMMAVCRYWYEKYQAVPAAVSHDEMEFYLAHPITEADTAWALAKEHYAFCNDRVDQCTGSGTVGEVAGTILNSNVWYFWWD